MARARTEVAATESEALALDRRRAELEHALAVLVGDVASDFSLPVAEWKTALPAIPAGIPGTVLARRPDVAAAQEQHARRAAARRRGEGRVVPRRVAHGHGRTTRPRNWATSSSGRRARGAWAPCSRCRCSTAAVATPACATPRAQLDEAIARYREQVLVAFRDVEDQLSALRLLAEPGRGAVAGGGIGRTHDGSCPTRATATAT